MHAITASAVLIFSDSDGAHELSLDRGSTSIGRLAGQDLVLSDRSVSRQHAVIQRVDDGYELADLESSQGTWVNGERVQRARLKAGDVIQFGSPNGIPIRFYEGPPAPSQPDQGTGADLLSAVHYLSDSRADERIAAREMGKLNFLLSAARKLNSGGAKDDVLHALLQLSIQLTNVERGFVFLREGGEMRLALGLRADGTIVQEDSTVSRRAMQRAIESTTKFSVSDTLADLEAGAWESVLANSIRCIYCLPLRKHISAGETETLLGLLYLDSQLNAGNLSSIDHELLDTIATEAATLLDNALLAEAEILARSAAEELAVAARIHASLMSMALPQVPYAEIRAKTVPCLAIGGDFYDAVELDDGLGIAIADVSGKGVPASIVAATLQGVIHAQMLTGQSLEQIARLVNRFLCTRSVGKYATMVLLKLYPDGLLEYVNCGHVRPLHITPGGARTLEQANLMVGLLPDANYTEGRCSLSSGDRILLATDGITEAENRAEEQFGDDRFLAAAQAEPVDGILGMVAHFQGDYPAQDDCTLVELRYLSQRDPDKFS